MDFDDTRNVKSALEALAAPSVFRHSRTEGFPKQGKELRIQDCTLPNTEPSRVNERGLAEVHPLLFKNAHSRHGMALQCARLKFLTRLG